MKPALDRRALLNTLGVAAGVALAASVAPSVIRDASAQQAPQGVPLSIGAIHALVLHQSRGTDIESGAEANSRTRQGRCATRLHCSRIK